MFPVWWKSDKPYIIGDCLSGVKSLPDKCVPLILTDPPYGVDYAKWDSDILLLDWFHECLRIADTVAFTPGHKHMYDYPEPDCLVSIVRPGSMQLQKKGGGFSHWEPVLVYGKRLPNPDMKIIKAQTDAPDCGHPCAKSVEMFVWLAQKMSEPGDVVLDPFLGSGTTLYACRKTGRIGLGFEINAQYEDIIRKRSMRDVPQLETFGGVT